MNHADFIDDFLPVPTFFALFYQDLHFRHKKNDASGARGAGAHAALGRRFA